MTEDFEINEGENKRNRLKKMSAETPQSRINRYKEERRKQLASQFAHLMRNTDSSTSSTTPDVNAKTTTFRPHNLNAAHDEDGRKPRTTSNNYKSPNKIRYKEDSSEDINEHKRKSNGSLTSDSSKSNRDKSAKRKSYLNRSVNSEKTPSINHNHNQHSHLNYHSAGEENNRKWNTRMIVPSSLPVTVAVSTTPASTSSTTFASSQKSSPSPKFRRKIAFNTQKCSSKSSCNGFAQTGAPDNGSAAPNLISKFSENEGAAADDRRPKTAAAVVDRETYDRSRIPRRIVSSPSPSPSPFKNSVAANDACDKKSSDFPNSREIRSVARGDQPSPVNGEIEYLLEATPNDRHQLGDHRREKTVSSAAETLFEPKNSLFEIIQNFSDRRDAEPADPEATHDRPSNATNGDEADVPDFTFRRSAYSSASATEYVQPQSHHSPTPSQNSSLEIIAEDGAVKPSILKKKFDERSVSLDASSKPYSILKRKTCEENAGSVGHGGNKQGILKKYSSLDEEEVRRRSRSPDVDNGGGKFQDFKPILKPDRRRSSMEELVRTRSPELHSILKRSKPNSEENSDSSATSPHGILKRKAFVADGGHSSASGDRASSFDSNSSKDACADADAVVRPILKNKQNSPEVAVAEKGGYVDAPRPILKKKQQSSENEADDERPKKPILKVSRKSPEEEIAASFSPRETQSSGGRIKFDEANVLESRTIKPILKKRSTYYMDGRSVKSDDDTASHGREIQRRVKRHSLPGPGILMRQSCGSPTQSEYQLPVVDNISNLESYLSDECKTHSEVSDERVQSPNISWRYSRFSRDQDRFKTQPVTMDEIVMSKSILEEKRQYISRVTVTHTRKEMDTDNDSTKICDNENSSQTDHDESKTSDSKDERNDEQRPDDKDVMNQLKRSNSVSMKASLFSQLEKDNRKALEESKMKKRTENNVGRRKLKVKCSDLVSRFATQPVTWEEVAEAKKQNLINSQNKSTNVKMEIRENTSKSEIEQVKDDPAYLPISERVKMFAKKVESQRGDVARGTRRCGPRFSTQPVTMEELQIAKQFATKSADSTSEGDKSTSGEFAPIRSPSSKSGKCDTRPSSKLDIKPSPRAALEKTYCENSSETGSQSEGDTSSSGGREIQSIIGGRRYHHQSENARASHENGSTKMNFGSVVTESATDVVDECPVINGNSSIAQRLAALKKSGQLDWQKRISRIAPEKEVPPVININETQELLKKELTNGFRCKVPSSEVRVEDNKKDGLLADRLVKLETARQTWKTRVEPSDAVQFSVAGKMASTLSTIPKLLPDTQRKKRGPCPSRFRSFRETKKECHSDPSSPAKSKSVVAPVCRSNSLPSDVADEDIENSSVTNEDKSVVNVPQIFDEEFSTFFGNLESASNAESMAELNSDFSDIKIEGPRLLPTHRKIRAQRKHATSGNPLKTLSTRIEIKNEYREVKTNVAERELKRINVEKLSKNSSLAVEVLAGLASKEDFQAVQLKKAAPLSSSMLPYKPLMLLHVKGRRYVQTRMVKPVVESVNSGDCYVLVTPKEVYHWIGQFANVIERSRGAEIAQHIVGVHDLGCTAATHVITIVDDSAKQSTKAAQNFWTLLGASHEQASSVKAVNGGHPDEDEIYESSLISTNMVYDVKDEELVPLEKYWAAIPKIQILDPNKVLVFDFGTELYVWMGKNVDLKLRRSSVKLAKELWENGFNYEECDVCPITSASTVGNREADSEDKNTKRGTKRPDWCLFAKVTQHMETVLFREKFLDWPDFSRVIRAKGKDEDTEKQTDGSIDINPCDVKEMLETKLVEPDLVLEGSHLGRGTKYFDEERKRYYFITTLDVRMWHIAEFESEEVSAESLGQFYSTDSYVVKWLYSISYTGRELSGQPSKHTTMGRDRCIYFCWQGKNASLNEQGAAALFTVELDKEKGVQLRICQGYEPPAFYNLFGGRMVVYKKKFSDADKEWRLFVCRGEIESEVALLEVSCNIRHLRSRASFVLLNVVSGVTYIWHGCKVTKEAVQACQSIVKQLSDNPPPELGLHSGVHLKTNEINEGSEPKEFFADLGGSSRKLYLSLLNDKEEYNETPLLYNLSSNSGTFCATSIWSPCRHKDIVTAYPFLQEDLYSASQPALFLLDTGKELWLWQGWWPEREKLILDNDQITSSEDLNHRGSATVRWQAERRAAMQTALDYWKHKYEAVPTRAFLVWAGLEPIQFTNLFPVWDDRDDVTEMNILDGRKPGEVLDVEQELERLTQSTYPIEQLLQRPLPDGVDPTKLELYLSPSHFLEILKVTKEEFAALPSWKQTNLKKNAGLF